jgi:hypothetical protein
MAGKPRRKRFWRGVAIIVADLLAAVVLVWAIFG